MNTLELVAYYADLLILQYIGKPRAYATIQAQATPVVMPQVSVQTITFPLIPDAGSFILDWGGNLVAPINWDDTAAEIQAKIRDLAPNIIDGGDAFTAGVNVLDGGDALTTGSDTIDGGDAFGFGLVVTVTGSIASGTLTVTFISVTPVAPLLVLVSSTLTSSAVPVDPVITEVDETLPLAVQNAFNVLGETATGAQLDVIGKYVGVSRSGTGFTTQITLDDADFTSLIQMAIIKNNAGSSLATIQRLLNQFFPAEVFVYDYADMRLSFFISALVGSQDLVQLFITENLLPVPMGVQYSVIYSPTADPFFGFRTYSLPAHGVSPFNSYTDYQLNRPWLSYAESITP